MIYGLQENNKVKASPSITNVICPNCKKELISACGEYNIWHFRHKTSKHCDSWYEPITSWHINWQKLWNKEQREVLITKDGNTHISDILNKNNTVLEFQNSPISTKEINARETFYDKMIWVFNGKTMRDKFSFKFKHDLEVIGTGKYRTIGFNHKYAKKYLYSCKKPVFIDFGTNYLYWLNFYLKEKPIFRETKSYEESREYADETYTVWESSTKYFYYPIKAIHRHDFLNHYA